uniref:Fatty acid synthase n=3 Tax=Drosophila melanogaster TaxID=7227 RepID=B7Z001_DROME|nr:fatty acid synthase 1, isoform C [Drosophila melanogaster]ACL82985.2 fatty acid synthase 1, isoform C [Drosophila melanogaster]|eukprot:NP_001137778.2 fatty acid synthase 1, isoform C [Drosophila melanogaster]
MPLQLNLLQAVDQPHPVAFKPNNCSTHQPQHSPSTQNNGKSARANRRRRRRRNKQQQNSQQPDAFRDTDAQLTPSTSSSTPHSAPNDRQDHLNSQFNPESINMPARFAEEVITAEPAQRAAPQLDLGGGHYVPRQQHLNDEIAITGFSGRLPESSTIEEFKQNLFDGVDMVNDDPRRWERGLYGLPDRIGKLKDSDLENFDQQFFGVHQKQAECMDPLLRMLLELTHEAIIDAGLNPSDLRGSRTGVYIGVSNSETEQHWCSDADRVNGYGLTGCARAMFANRISFTFDFKGPSYSIDTACSSSLYALEQAFSDMREGKVDNALVAGAGLILKPTMSLQFKRLNMLSPDGSCKAFDESGNGYVRSDGCVVLLLQRTSAARRVYASILNVRTNTDGFKEQGITYPIGKMQNRLIRETYEEIGLNPADVVYVEAHGTGTKVGDPQEVNSITDFFCKDRTTPLLIGSVKSNMGHSEPASGVCSVAKILIAMEEGVIPGNLHYNKPNPDLYGLVDGRLKVVDRNLPWNGGIIGLNSFGFGGANAHVILKSNPKPKALTPKDGALKVVLASGRTFEAVEQLLESASTNADDDEYLQLINEIHSKAIPNHFFRGYGVVSSKGTHQREVIESNDDKRPIWYIYSGMGSQWASMAKDLMKIEAFAKTIQRCADVLKPEGVDLIDVLTRSTDKSFENILNSFISIAAMQVALTDLLSSLGIHPDGIVGHSVGELGCAYADGCFTPEQTVLAAYWRGKSILDTQLAKGKMAAVGLSWEDAHSRVPSDCFPVCHNSEDNCTISGPEASIEALVAKLNAEGVFAKAVNSSGYAFHSKYIAEAGPKLRKSLEKIIPNAKNRTARWISTSIPESAWNTPVAKQSSAAYHVNNLLSPVLFHEALQHVPKNAISVEIAPHGLLQAILKRALGPDATNLSLVKRGHENNVEFFLTNVGKLFAAGAQPQVLTLVRPISYPVGRGTPMLNSKVGWDHTQKWLVAKFGKETSSGETIVEVDLSKEDDAFLAGHTIDGRILFPATGYMTLAWQTFAKMQGSEFHKTPVVMENLVFHRATILNKNAVVKFGINFFDGTGAFEICESGSLAVSGKITIPESIDNEELPLEEQTPSAVAKELGTNDVYKELRLRGYDYGGIFRGIVRSDTVASTGKLQWVDNWISFMDTMLQFSILSKNLRELYLPTRIERAVINPAKHFELLSALTKEEQVETGLPVQWYSDINVIKSAGVELRGLKANLAQRRPGTQAPPTLERYQFVPNINTTDLNENSEKARLHALDVAIQVIIENSSGAVKLKGVELANGRNPDVLVANRLLQIIEGEPVLTGDVAVVTSNNNEETITAALGDSGVRVVSKDVLKEPVEQNCHFVFGIDVLSRPDTKTLENSIASIRENGFLILEETLPTYTKTGRALLTKFGFVAVQEQSLGATRVLVLARKAVDLKTRKSVVVVATEQNFNWVDDLKAALATAATEEQYVYVVCQGEELFGAVGLMTCIKNENGGKLARLVFVQDAKAEKFSLTSTLYRQQLEKDLISNVLKNGAWGTFRHLKLETQQATLQVEHAYVNALVKGDLASLKWIEAAQADTAATVDKNLETCTVYYAPINFRDVMLTSGKLAADALPGDLAEQDCVLGLEFAGRDTQGRRVMAMVPAKSLATTCVASKRMMWQIPEKWTMEEASTVPCVYSTVYYALVVRGQMKKGEKILIHAGSGGVGQAAISVALAHGLTVFTTVGSKEKREFLLKRFPKLQERNIGNSRDTSFEQLVLRETKGRGVDLVLNSLSEEKLQASIRCLGLNGRFLEIGKFDLSNNSPLGMSVFLKNTSFHGILLDSVMEGEEEMQNQVVSLVAEGIKTGAVVPLPTSVFNDQQVEQAFRFMASGKHIGKVVIKVRDEEAGKKALQPKPRLINAIPRTYMHPEKSYILVGGLGGFGLELTNWLVTRGARYIVLTSRSGVKTGYQGLMIRRWQERGVKVVIDTSDVTTAAGAKKLLENSNKLALVGGIFNLAAVLRDALIEDQTAKDFKTVADPKVTATKYLDQFSRDICTELDYFICFSSVSCGRGNIGQTNYGLANSAMERICEQRQVSGFPGTAIQWGAIGDTGLVLENLGDNDTVIGGTLPQRMPSCLQTIDLFLQQPHPVVASMVVAEKRKSDQSAGVSLIATIANILGLRDTKNIQDGASLADLGMDSLMSAEIKQTLERNFDIVLSAQEIRQLTFGALKAMDGGADVKPAAAAPAAAAGVPEANITSGGSSRTASPMGDGTQVVFTTSLIPTEAIVQLDTKAPANSKQSPIFFISPIEGFASALEPLAKRLEVPAYGLQYTEAVPSDSLESAAKFFIKQLRTVQPKGPYKLAGYSFGCLLTYVMAGILEETNEVANVIMLDGAPSYVNWYTSSFKQRYTDGTNADNDNQSYGLAYFGIVLANIDYKALVRLLIVIPTWEEKLERFAELMSNEITQPVETIKKSATLFYKKLELADGYQPTLKLKTNVTLVKPTDNSAKLDEDYRLKEVCTKPVEVHTVEGNHRTFLIEDQSLKTIQSILKRLFN